MSVELIAFPFRPPPEADIFPDVRHVDPAPIQIRMTERPQPEGDVLRNFFLVWDEDDGTRCRRCPASRCNREAIPGTGTSSCLRMLRGRASDRFAASVGVEV